MNIGWIGTGIMGLPMAGHLQQAGHTLHVHSRTRDKAAPLLQRGARWCASPADMAAGAEIVFTMVGFPADVENVYLGPQGLLSVEGSCRIVVDMTTTRPQLAREIAHRASAKHMAALDAPVSGGDVGAREATLAIMVGGDRAAFETVLPLLQGLGRHIAYMGEAGAGQHAKLCNQIVIAGTMIGVCESLLYAARQGLDPQAVIHIIEKGAAASWLLSHLGVRMAQNDFRPGFYVEHFIKDLGLALREAEAAGLALPGLALAHQLYLSVQALGHGRDGTQALLLALRALNGR